jgi:Aerotolerance regulator N-terminal
MIGFLHPWVLLGLAAASIPVLLHLLARREPPTVVFPAVRYLITTTREHQRRLKLQNLLLLILRTLLVVALVLAAAGPTMPLRGVASHAPSALVLILDNSPSSGVVVSGSARLAQLQEAARGVLARATPDDALWLISADGIPRRGEARTLIEQVGRLSVSPERLDLGAALRLARDVLASDGRPGELVLLSDLQASAVSPAEVTTALLVGRSSVAPPANVGIARLDLGPQPWSSDGGRITVALAGDSGPPLPLSATIGNRPARQALLRVGGNASLNLTGMPAGWWVVRAQLDPDELRIDDRREGVVRVAPVARVTWDPQDRFVAAACQVLVANRRLARGDEITFGRLGRGGSIIVPPSDPAELGALNRALSARGIGWSFGSLVVTAGATDSSGIVGRTRVLRRYQLRPTTSGRTGVLVTVAGSPWLVRSGDVLLLGSRLDPAWTELPVSAGFMPFIDVLLNRLARGELTIASGAPGDPIDLPDLVSTVRQGQREWRVEGGGTFRPSDLGEYYLLAEKDTIGALSVNPDPRESLLAPASDAEIRRLWKGARVVDLPGAGEYAFSSASRGDLRGALLWSALILGLLELGMASGWRRA